VVGVISCLIVPVVDPYVVVVVDIEFPGNSCTIVLAAEEGVKLNDTLTGLPDADVVKSVVFILVVPILPTPPYVQ
jgi:hypothetical protein